jgi:predicted RNA binding protein YcfA (HicA-like mRNA interferase family)
MPAWGPISRRHLIRALRTLGFHGPFSGGHHQFMVRDDLVLVIPNPHGSDLGIGLLSRMPRQTGITRTEWENA